jgi:hypothetical protein
MLVLDAIRLMETIWKSENLDLRVTPYRCIATGVDHGEFRNILFQISIVKRERENKN